MSFTSNKSSSKDLLEKLQKQVAAQAKGSTTKDDRFWQPSSDATGAGSAVIRFLPSKDDEVAPFVHTYRHAFKEAGNWYIENCPTTLGNGAECPVCKSNGVLWNSGIESDKSIARDRKRKEEYIANVLIIKDPVNREIEGTVKLYRFGPKIWEKVLECMKGDEDANEEARNPFGIEDGVNFNLKLVGVQVNGQTVRNYDKSKFVAAGDLLDNDEEKLTEISKQLHDLQAFIDPTNYKPYDQLETRLNKVLGIQSSIRGTVSVVDQDDEEFDSTPEVKQVAATSSETTSTGKPEIDADLEFLRNLAEKDPF